MKTYSHIRKNLMHIYTHTRKHTDRQLQAHIRKRIHYICLWSGCTEYEYERKRKKESGRETDR